MIAWYAGIITLLGAATIAVIAWFVASRHVPQAPTESVIPRVYKVRFWYFLLLLAVLIAVLAVTLGRLPYPQVKGQEPVLTISVVGRMWAWELHPASTQGKAGEAAPAGQGLVLPVGRPVEFEVTSQDVNHGFGIYDDDGHLFAQTQAMPGYVNRLKLVFDRPGQYRVLCLEYCGLAHHAMFASFQVK